MVGVMFETFWKFENVFGRVVVRKVGHVFGTFFEDVVKCLEKCLESVCDFRDCGKCFRNVFLKVWESVFGNDVITFLKVWFLLETCFGNVLESPGKLFVEKRLFLFERLSFDKFLENWTFGKLLEQFWKGLIPFAASAY